MSSGGVLSHQPAELGDAEPRLQGAVDGRAQQGGTVGDDAVQLPGRHHEVFALLRHPQGRDARRNHWQAQTGRVQMLAAAGLGRAEAGVGELQRPAQTLGFRRAEAVHTDEGRGPHFPHQRTGQRSIYYSVKVPLFDEAGAIYALCGISTDITEIKRVSASLLEEQAFSRLLLDSLPGIFYLYSYPDLRLQRWNKQHETLLGFSPAEMLGRHVTEWFYPGAEEALLASARTAMETGAHSVEAPLLAKDGRSVHFLLNSVKFETPGQTYLMGIGIDTSWRKDAENQLQLAASVFAHAREGIMITDLAGHIIDVNEAFTRITGYAREEALGRNPRFLNSGRQDHVFYAELWRSLIDDGHWYGELWNRRKNGDLFAEMQNISTVYDAQGKPTQ